ncbi:hypothetical protein EKD16_23695 [Streptomonospora litoralis]|uniref:Uncharacterized protein n=1 Tax=Streptomonospora litoralis TaxID=2498135 RepID=A0A4P6Q6X4_9ACTN|nr:hypothetical protein EKD16_23695 [Streptomonospora litoralis]
MGVRALRLGSAVRPCWSAGRRVVLRKSGAEGGGWPGSAVIGSGARRWRQPTRRRGVRGAGRRSRARYVAGQRGDRARMTKSSRVLWESGHDRRGRLRHIGHSGRGDWGRRRVPTGPAQAGGRAAGRGRGLSRAPGVRRIGGRGGDDTSLVAPGRGRRALHPPVRWTFGGLCPFCGRPRRTRRPRDARKVDVGAVFAPFGAPRGPSPPRRGCGPAGKPGIHGKNTPCCFVSRNHGARTAPRGDAEAGAAARTCIS